TFAPSCASSSRTTMPSGPTGASTSSRPCAHNTVQEAPDRSSHDRCSVDCTTCTSEQPDDGFVPPDTIDEAIADGDEVGVRGTLADGRAVVVPEIQLYRVAGGRIAERWFVVDRRELGAGAQPRG